MVHFPRDEGPHDVPVEWWYFNGHLAGQEGLRYSFHFVGFQLACIGALGLKGLESRIMHLTLATPGEDLAVEDSSPKGLRVKAARGALGRLETPGQRFAVAVEDWSMEGANGRYHLEAAEGEYGFSLDLEETKQPVLHGGSGIVSMGPAGDSYYYSRTRLKAQGTVTVRGDPREVSGEAWMDHQWGDFDQIRVSWDWFSLQLDDDTEAMVFLLWDFETGELIQRSGTYVLPDGSAQYLQLEDIQVTSLDSWTSPRTGIDYPSGWQLQIAPQRLHLKLEPVHLDAEFDVGGVSPLDYWEGEVIISGRRDGEPVTGRGFVELVGYDRRTLQSSSLQD